MPFFNLNRLTDSEQLEFGYLKEKIFGSDMFVEVNFSDPHEIRYNWLMCKAMGCEYGGSEPQAIEIKEDNQ